MKKKIDKIQIIDAPKENILESNELLDFLGGDNCGTYYQCEFLKNTTCIVFDTYACGGGTAGTEPKCDKYFVQPM